MASTIKLQVRRDLAATWTSLNPTMLIGEIGFETDTRKLKIGTSTIAWNDLGYVVASAAAHTHTKSEVTDFTHTHAKADITDFGSYAAVGHEHAISDLDTTGTPSVSTFLRGDGAWSAPSIYSNLGNVSGNVTLNLASANVFMLTMTGNITLAVSNLPASPPMTCIVRIAQGGSGSYAITWNSVFKHPNNTAPTIGTAVGDAEWFLLEMVSGTRVEVFKADGPYKA